MVRGEGLATPGGNREPFAPGLTLITPCSVLVFSALVLSCVMLEE